MRDEDPTTQLRAIAVDIDLPARNRLAAALHRTGHRRQLVDDLHEWITSHHDAVVFFSAGSSSPHDEPLFRNARRYQVDLIAVISGDAAVGDYRRWLRIGCTSIVDIATSMKALTLQVEAALLGSVVIPTKSAAAIAHRLAEPPAGFAIDRRQTEILEALASGATVPAIAKLLDRSDRHTRRLVRQLIDQMEATNTHAALANAVRWGWIIPS
jgi:DNA-binding CsgD family transcriptional regulator